MDQIPPLTHLATKIRAAPLSLVTSHGGKCETLHPPRRQERAGHPALTRGGGEHHESRKDLTSNL